MDSLSFWRKWKHRLLSSAQCCVLCHDSASDGLCPGCLGDLAEIATDAANSCPLCFRPIIGGTFCGHCQKTPPKFERMWASVYYEAPVRGMIHAFKHSGDLSMQRPLAELMWRNAPDWLRTESIDWVLPMPLSKARRLERGFNQSEVLAEQLVLRYGWQLLPPTVVKRMHKPPQSTLSGQARRQNIRQSFTTDNQSLRNCNILLIDDVFTTGSTLDELARTLKKSGVQRIYCWTLARSLLKR